jgi:hypothetical protein
MPSLRAGSGVARGTYVMGAWALTFATIPFVITVVTAGVRIAIGRDNGIAWLAGDAIVTAQIALTPLQFVSLSRMKSGSMRATVCMANAVVLLTAEIVAARLLRGY